MLFVKRINYLNGRKATVPCLSGQSNARWVAISFGKYKNMNKIEWGKFIRKMKFVEITTRLAGTFLKYIIFNINHSFEFTYNFTSNFCKN